MTPDERAAVLFKLRMAAESARDYKLPLLAVEAAAILGELTELRERIEKLEANE